MSRKGLRLPRQRSQRPQGWGTDRWAVWLNLGLLCSQFHCSVAQPGWHANKLTFAAMACCALLLIAPLMLNAAWVVLQRTDAAAYVSSPLMRLALDVANRAAWGSFHARLEAARRLQRDPVSSQPVASVSAAARRSRSPR